MKKNFYSLASSPSMLMLINVASVMLMALALTLAIGCNSEDDPSSSSSNPGSNSDFSSYYFRDVEEISATDTATCLRRGGLAGNPNVFCWGDSSFGQNGQSQTSPIPSPIYFHGTGAGPIENAMKISSGSAHSCALLQTGNVACWGRNDLGQLGSGTTDAGSKTAQIVKKADGTSLTGAVDLATGSQHSCAIVGPTRTIYCWGSNFSHQLGTYPGFASPEATQVMVGTGSGSPITNAEYISAGLNFTCYLGSSDQVSCWGSNQLGVLGYGSTTITATTVPRTAKARDFSVYVALFSSRNTTSCATDIADNIFCWGSNRFSQIGSPALATGTNALFMELASSVRNVVSGPGIIRMGNNHACIIDNGSDDGRVYCWGSNNKLQLGVASSLVPTSSSAPQLVQGIGEPFLTKVKDLALGSEHSCALFKNKTVACWGSDATRQIGYVGPNAGTAGFSTQTPTMIYEEVPPGLQH